MSDDTKRIGEAVPVGQVLKLNRFSDLLERKVPDGAEVMFDQAPEPEDPNLAAYNARVRARAAELELERRAATDAAEEETRAWRRRARLQRRGIPAKDIAQLLLAESGGWRLEDTKALEVARALLVDPSRPIVVICGGKGCGKTLACSWLVMQDPPEPYFDPERPFLGKGKAPWPDYLRPRYLPAWLMARVDRFDRRAAIDAEEPPQPGQPNQRRAAPALAALEQCSILAIDDLGIQHEDNKGVFASLLDGLVDARYTAKLRTVLTSNMSLKDFKEHYGERLWDRLREFGRVVEINSPSLRGRKPEGER